MLEESNLEANKIDLHLLATLIKEIGIKLMEGKASMIASGGGRRGGKKSFLEENRGNWKVFLVSTACQPLPQKQSPLPSI